MSYTAQPVRAGLALLLFAGMPLFGQAGLGSISGEVLDSTGARLPHAVVKLLETSTHTVSTTASNDVGLFNFPSVAVGHYTLTVTNPGFKDKELTNLTLTAFQQLSLGQITLEVGQGTTQTVTVTAEQELIKDSAARIDAIQARTVEDMPTAGRNWTTLMKIIPGANATATTNGSIAFNGREYTATGYGDFRINGKNAQQTQVNLDGGSIVDQGSDAKTTVAPGMESIEQVSILANNFQAEYGYRAGAVVNIITKSGTNAFHGAVFDNLRNEDLNANSWSNNYLGLPRAQYRYNYVGGNLGGPVKKNKLFFFYNYENFIQSTPAPTTLSLTPTALERTGDFSQTLNSNGTKPTIYQPGSQFSGAPIPFPGNVIPKNLINPLGTAIMNLFPLPNLANNYPVNNYALQYQTKQPRFDHTAKVDWNIANNTRMYVRFTDDGGTQVDRSLGGTSGNLTAATFDRPRPDRALAGNFTHTFSPTLVMEGLVAWSFDRVDWQVPDQTALTKTANGLEDLPLAFKPTNDILPAMNISPYPSFAFGRLPAYSYTDEYQMAANFSWSKGSHLIKFGFLHVRNYKNEVDQSGPGAGNDKGTFDFSSSPSPFDTGFAPSNVLVGAVSSFTQTSEIAHKDAMFTDTDFYIQDTWKVKPTLTLDYGIRMYHMPSQHEINPANTLDAAFLPSKWTAAKAVRLYVPDPANSSLIIDPAFPNNPLPSSQTNLLKYTIVPGSGDPLDGVVALGSPGIGLPGILNPNTLLFAPRGGFAWSPGNGKNVIRGGFGWGYNRDNISQAMNAFENGLSKRADVVQTSLASLASSSGVQPIPIVSLGAMDESSRKVPTVYDYSVSVQRQLPFDMVAEVAYVGNIQRHQPIQFNINAVSLGTAFLPQFVTPGNTGYNFYGPVTASNPGALPGSNAEDASVMRPYPGFSSLTMNENGANVHYNSLQATLSKRFGHGLMFSAAYTYGRTAGQIENLGPYNYNWQKYTGYILSNDRSQVLTVNYSYDVPELARRIHFDNLAGREILDGWRLDNVITYFSGSPYSPSFSVQEANTTTNVSLGSVFLGSPDFTPRNTVTGDVNAIPGGSNLKFNPGALGVPGIYPTADGTGPRNFINGLGSFTNDLSVVKTIRITEKHGIELRASAFNLFNNVRRINTNTSIQYKALGPTAASGFTIINTPDVLAASQAAKTSNPVSIYNAYVSGVGSIALNTVQPMRIIEIGLMFRF